jgi:hypothetical protein
VSKPAPATWACPICGRRVPKREPECFCGAKQQAAEQHHQQEARKKSTRVPLDVALLVLAVVAVGVYGLRRLTQDLAEPQAPGGKLLAAVAPTPEPPPAAVAPPLPALPSQAPPTTLEPPALLRAPPPPALEAVQTPAPEPPRLVTPPPAPAPTATPFDERAQVRAAGLAAYEAALGRLASIAGGVAENLMILARECAGDAPRVSALSNCADIEAAIQRQLVQIQKGLEAADDDARRAWLDPGQLRDARARSVFGSRQWDDLVSAAQRLKR